MADQGRHCGKLAASPKVSQAVEIGLALSKKLLPDQCQHYPILSRLSRLLDE
jgi:hypothetical protein